MTGVFSLAQLRELGVTRRRLETARRHGRLIKLRNGWYAQPDADPQLVTAVTHRGSLSCVSVLRRRGVWLPHDDRLHISVPRTASRLGKNRAIVRHYRPDAGVDAPEHGVEQALLHALVCLPRDFAVAALDSVLDKRVMSMAGLEALIGSGMHAPLLRLAEQGCQSGIETLPRLRLRRRGVPVRI